MDVSCLGLLGHLTNTADVRLRIRQSASCNRNFRKLHFVYPVDGVRRTRFELVSVIPVWNRR